VASDIHVLQVGPLYVNHVRRWSDRACALGCRVSVAGHVRPNRRAVDFGEACERLEVVPEEAWREGADRREAWLRGVIEDVRPDLVQAHWLPTWSYLAGRAFDGPLVVTPWGSDVYLAEGLERELADRALERADAVIARSPHMRRELAGRGVPDSRLHRVDLGVDTRRFRPASQDERRRLRRELGLGEGPVVLSLRAGTALYNLDVVVEAFASLAGRFGDATLVLLTGDAPLDESVRSALLAAHAPDRILVVSVPHDLVADYARAADAGISIPDSDGSPNSVWEALSSGLPMVLSDLPQVREVVGERGGALYVEPRAEPVAEALAAILSGGDRRAGMEAAAREWAERNADPRRGAEQLGLVYDAARASGRPVRDRAGRTGRSPAAAPPSSRR
jgi:glycosyltransferase involved in cell wall biosynthesis